MSCNSNSKAPKASYYSNSIEKKLSDFSILIVEDQFIVAAGIEKTLRIAGASSVTVAGTMQEAWKCATEDSFDAAILDIRLPDGYSFPLALDLFSQGVPVVMHSGHAEIYHSAKLPGIIFCPKPATPAEMVDSIVQAQQLAKDSMIADRAELA